MSYHEREEMILFPDEINLIILKYLDTFSIIRCTRLCKQWRRNILDGPIKNCQTLDLSPHHQIVKFNTNIHECWYFKAVICLNVTNCRIESSDFKKLLKCANLIELKYLHIGEDLIGMVSQLYSEAIENLNDRGLVFPQNLCQVSVGGLCNIKLISPSKYRANLPSSQQLGYLDVDSSGNQIIFGSSETHTTILECVIFPLLFPKFFDRYSTNNHLLLFGPRGCGKSMILDSLTFLNRVQSLVVPSEKCEKRFRMLFDVSREFGRHVHTFVNFDNLEQIYNEKDEYSYDHYRRFIGSIIYELDQETKIFTFFTLNNPHILEYPLRKRLYKRIYHKIPQGKDIALHVSSNVERMFGSNHQIQQDEIEHMTNMVDGYSPMEINSFFRGLRPDTVSNLVNTLERLITNSPPINSKEYLTQTDKWADEFT